MDETHTDSGGMQAEILADDGSLKQDTLQSKLSTQLTLLTTKVSELSEEMGAEKLARAEALTSILEKLDSLERGSTARVTTSAMGNIMAVQHQHHLCKKKSL